MGTTMKCIEPALKNHYAGMYSILPYFQKIANQSFRDNRELERKERYLIGLEGASFSKGLASFRVRDAETADLELFLNISAIKGNIFRVQFEEVGSTRFHIEYMLDGEPDTVKYIYKIPTDMVN